MASSFAIHFGLRRLRGGSVTQKIIFIFIIPNIGVHNIIHFHHGVVVVLGLSSLSLDNPGR